LKEQPKLYVNICPREEQRRGVKKKGQYKFPVFVLSQPIHNNPANFLRTLNGIEELIRHCVHLAVSVSWDLALGLQLQKEKENKKKKIRKRK
jgi:hypothetical protein